MNLAIEKARQAGVSWVGVRNSNHFGACAYYSTMALDHDMIGIAATQGGSNLMAPWGGTTALLGNNPISYAIPALEELPIVLDMAMSVVAGGKLILAQKKGEKIPATWAMDTKGKATTDPTEGLRGLLSPIAGYKATGLRW